MPHPVLEVENLRTHIALHSGVARAVDGVSFALHEGEVLALVGESGSGKSMTAFSLLGLFPTPAAQIQPGSSIRLHGRELVGAGAATLAAVRGQEIAMIYQDPWAYLNPVLTIGEQVGEALAVRGEPGWQGRVLQALARVGLPDPPRIARSYPHQLSGGMGQRALIAAALIARPAVLLADEPTTALDVTVQAQILNLLDDLRQELGMAVLLVTHDLGVAASIADRIIILYAGKILEQGQAAGLLACPLHPYTRSLLRSVLTADRATSRLEAIPGNVPNPADLPTGCRFHPRCQARVAPCAADEPPLSERMPGHLVACWRPGEAADG